jgi:manganese transport protein
MTLTAVLPTDPAPARTARRRIGAISTLGPGFVAAIAYVDPGNFATNFAAGAGFGYRLLWVVVVANAVAMLVQFLAAKLGVVTGRSLPQLCRERWPGRPAWTLWAQAEVVAMATDLAEFIGAAVGLNLLFGLPLPAAGLVTAVIAFGVLALQQRGHRPFELAIGALLALICVGFGYLLLVAPQASGEARDLVPGADAPGALFLALGIVGATVMPHAVYLHSGLTSGRQVLTSRQDVRRVLRWERLDIAIAMGLAGLVNAGMLAIAAQLFHGSPSITLEHAHEELGRLVGGGAALAFAAVLLASGISSSAVGTAAGQIVMEGFLGARIPLVLRRLVTMIPALVLLALGTDPTQVLVASQVVLSFGLPFALIALLVLTSSRAVMGEHVNSRTTTLAVGAVVTVLSGLNLVLLAQQLL